MLHPRLAIPTKKPDWSSPLCFAFVSVGLILSSVIAHSQTNCSTDTSIAPADSITQFILDNNDCSGNCTPLILIHGINGRDDSNPDNKDGWQRLENYLINNGVTNHYRIYRFRYDSNQQPVQELGRSLRNAIDAGVVEFPDLNGPIVIIAHSLGGLVARSFMNEWAVTKGINAPECGGERVLKLVTLATPHHGSPSANGAVRVPAEFQSNWSELPSDVDLIYWTFLGDCFACLTDLAHPNRGDLRYDNRGPQPGWSTTEYSGQEVNTWLLNLKHTYDSRIIAYYGFIGSNNDITTELGEDLPITLEVKAARAKIEGDFDTVLTILGVLLQRITSETFDDPGTFDFLPLPITEVFNDGVVPIFSGAFENASVAKSIACLGYNHNQILNNGDSGAACFNGLTPFASVVQDLNNEIPPPNSFLVDPRSSWDYGQVTAGSLSDKVFTFKNTGTSAFSLKTFIITGPNANEFFAPKPPALPLSIPPGQTQSITVRFQPASTGSKQSTLAVTTDTSTDSAAPIALSGQGTQAACNATLSTTQIEVAASGGSQSFNVTAPTGCPWVVSGDPSFITITSPSQGLGSGNGSVMFTLPANPGTLRISKIMFSAGTSTQSVLVIQDGVGSSCNYQLSATSNVFPASGGTGAFTIAAASGCSWMVSSSQSFVTFSSLTSGSGTAGIAYTVASNTLQSMRFSTVSVTTPTGVLAYIVEQDAASSTPCSYSLSSSGKAYTADAWDDAFLVNAAAGCSWTARSSDSWIALLSSGSPAGGGSGSVGFQIFPNAGSTLRMSSITVQGQGQSSPLMYTIWQQPPFVGTPHIVLPVTDIAIGGVLVGTKVNQTVQVQNTGNKDLTIAAINLVSGSQDFFVSSFIPTVTAGSTNTFQISFQPSTTGEESAVFSIQSNDPNTPTVDLTITGNGIPKGKGGTDFAWTTLTGNGPTGLTESAVATIGNTIYLFGGRRTISTNAYDPTIPQWSTLPDMPHGILDPGAAVIGNKIYVLGDIVSNQVQIFDTNAKSWSLGAALPDQRTGMAVAAVGGKLYAFGGTLSGSVLSKVAVYDAASDQWSTAADMITGRAFASAATVNGLVYVIGGNLDQGVRTGVTEIFDPVANTWTNREDMPTRRSSAAIAVLGTDIYVFGGYGNFDATNSVEKQDTTVVKDNPFLTQTWTEKNALLQARGQDAAAFVNGKAFVFGGSTLNGDISTNEEGDLTAAPVANISETNVSFGDLAVNSIAEVAITVTNSGNAGLTLSYGFSQTDQEFQIIRAPSTLSAGQSSDLILRFTPNSTGGKTISLVITTNDTAHASITVSLAGNGIQPPTPVTGTWRVAGKLQLPANVVPFYMAISAGTAYVGINPSGLLGIDLATGNLKFQSVLTQQSFPGIPSVDVQHVYVPLAASGGIGQVAVADSKTGAINSYITAGHNAFASATGQGLVYASDEVQFSDGSPSPVFVIDGGSGSVLTSIPTGLNPNYIAIDPNAQRGYVTTIGTEGTSTSGLTIFDTVTNIVIGSVATRYTPRSLAVSNGRVYIGTDAGIEVLDQSTNAIVARVPLPRDSSSITENMGQIFVVNNTLNTVTVVDTTSLSVVQTLNPGNGPFWIATDPSTHMVYVVNQTDKNIVSLQPNAPTMGLNCSPLSLSAYGTGVTACAISSNGGLSGTISLSCADLPGNSTCSFDRSSIDAASLPTTVHLLFRSDRQLVPGSYAFTTRAAGASLTREISVPYTVQAPIRLPLLGADFDADLKTDLAIWRPDPSNGTWWAIRSSDGNASTRVWGVTGDKPVPGDYDGDGKTDFAIWRPDPSAGTWWVVRSSDGSIVSQTWGVTGDIPVPGDYDGDGKTDFAVWRPSTGTWFVIRSSDGVAVSQTWGVTGDIPVPGDYDGDGKTDFAVWRPSTGTWYVIRSSDGAEMTRIWGVSGDIPVPGDYDGDGKTDFAIWRPSTGTWWVIHSSDGGTMTQTWGVSGDIPVPGDYDGDGRTDFAVWRPSNGTWYITRSSDGVQFSRPWGVSTDIPINKPIGQ